MSGATLYGAMLLLPLSFQELRGTDALGAGLLLIPQGVGSLLSRSTAGRLTDRVGARAVGVVAFAVIGVATLPFAFADATTPEWWLLLALLVRGAGLGAAFIPLMAVGFIGLEKAEMPHASTVTRIAQQIGGAAGTAVLAVVLQGAAAAAGPVAGFQDAFWWAFGFTVVAAPLSLLLPGCPQPVDASAEPALERASA